MNHLKLNNRQFGFRSETGCSSALLVLKEVINKYTAENFRVFCAMIDISKASDKINFNIMKNKLEQKSLPRQVISIIDYMLRNTYVKTCVDGEISEPWKMENGTRQGGINSPLLFSYYIDHMIYSISRMS